MPPASPHRQLRHRRTLDVQVYDRGDGHWEVDARLSDVKTRDVRLANGIRAAGEPIHDMQLRLVIDEQMNILEAGSEGTWLPYPGQCDQHGEAYGRLVGLNLMRGFRREVQARVGGLQGCTHLTELAQVLPTAVIQAFAGDVIDTLGDGQHQPFQLDRCHALRTDGPAVLQHYPRWYRRPADAAEAPAHADRSGADTPA
ncbi:DUF2889 domain-containing protein [Piscinibacter sakaiensis]|nr:DUF2889 domain-containing protein [Piscinibacter sakaiensis]